MQGNKIIQYLRNAFHGRVYQSLAIVFCVLFGVVMIINTQLSGEAEWFWYASLLHGRAKLYADLHLALPPLLILETNAWIQLFGVKCLVTEIPSLLHVLVFCLAIFLILRESDWPDWQKAIVLAGAFLLSVECVAYRFDDFHVLADTFIFYSLVLLLLMAKDNSTLRQLGLATGLGILSGLAITTRLTDGAALLVASGICAAVLAKKTRFTVVTIFFVSSTLTAISVVKLTGDTLRDYALNSIIKAAAAKGGTHSILPAPFLIVRSAFEMEHGRKWLLLCLLAIIGTGALVWRYWKSGIRYIVVLQLGIAGVALFFCSHSHREQLLSGTFVSFVGLGLLIVNYLLLPVVLARYFIWRAGNGKRDWDAREILILLPLAELASASASTGGTTGTLFFSPIAMLLLLVPVTQPFRRWVGWANLSFVTIMVLLGLSSMAEKIHDPYSWLLFRSNPMFVDRQWFRHPVYGPLYLDRETLTFFESVCREVNQENSSRELLSMPFAYPNYLCATPPWHGYVQTFYDTSTPSTIAHLMSELDTAPPQWIVYQRQMKVLKTHEEVLHNGQPLAHRALDEMIMQKIEAGQWQLVQKRELFRVEKSSVEEGDGWWVIRTRP